MELIAGNAVLVADAGINDMPDSSALSGVKVMVIDDSNTIRRSAEIFLLQAGCTVILAEDGLTRWRKSPITSQTLFLSTS